MNWKSTEIAFPGIPETFYPARFWATPDGRHVVMEEVCWEPRSTRLRVYAANEEGLLALGTLDLEETLTPTLAVTNEAIAWWKNGRMNALGLPHGERAEVPVGCVLAGGFPAVLGASAARVAAKGWRTYRPFVVSPDARFFAAPNHRHEVDVIFDAETVEEAKALAKKQHVLGLSNHAVAVATKASEWALLASGTWKKIGAGKCTAGIREAHFSPDGTYLALVADKTITIVDAQTGALVGEQTMSHTVEDLRWITGQRLVCKLYNKEGQGLGETYRVLDPGLAVRVRVEAVADAKPVKKAKAKPSRSAELGLPFELEWSQPEAVLPRLHQG